MNSIPLSPEDSKKLIRQELKNRPINPIEIHVCGSSITVYRIGLPIQYLSHDRVNRRIYDFLKQDELSDAAIEKELYDRSLARQIRQNGGIIEPLYVMTNGVVIEGNRRLSAVRKLNRDFPDNKSFSNIPCFLLPENVNENILKHLLLNWHIAGRKPYQPFERASFIADLVNDSTEADVAAELGKSKYEISKIVSAFELTSQYGQYIEEGERTGKFKHKKKSFSEKFSTFEAILKDQAAIAKTAYFKLRYAQNIDRFRDTVPQKERFHTWVRDDIFPLIQQEIIAYSMNDTKHIVEIMSYGNGNGKLWNQLQTVNSMKVILDIMEETHPEQGEEGKKYEKILAATKAVGLLLINSDEISMLKSGNKMKMKRFIDLHDILDRILAEINR